MEDGDFLVMATDGVLDNLFNEDIDFVIQTLHKEDEGIERKEPEPYPRRLHPTNLNQICESVALTAAFSFPPDCQA